MYRYVYTYSYIYIYIYTYVITATRYRSRVAEDSTAARPAVGRELGLADSGWPAGPAG